MCWFHLDSSSASGVVVFTNDAYYFTLWQVSHNPYRFQSSICCSHKTCWVRLSLHTENYSRVHISGSIYLIHWSTDRHLYQSRPLPARLHMSTLKPRYSRTIEFVEEILNILIVLFYYSYLCTSCFFPSNFVRFMLF